MNPYRLKFLLEVTPGEYVAEDRETTVRQWAHAAKLGIEEALTLADEWSRKYEGTYPKLIPRYRRGLG